jgi:hypothetical protein
MNQRIFAGGLALIAILSLFACKERKEDHHFHAQAAIVSIQALIQIDGNNNCSQYLLPSGGGRQVRTAFPWLQPRTSASSYDQIQWKAQDKNGDPAAVAVNFGSTLGGEPNGTPFFKGNSFSTSVVGSFTPYTGGATTTNPGDYYFQSVVVTDQDGNHMTCTNPGSMGVHVQD